MNDPRVVRFGSFEYRYRNGRLEWRVPGGATWLPDPHPPEQFAAVASLKEHPWIDSQESAA